MIAEGNVTMCTCVISSMYCVGVAVWV